MVELPPVSQRIWEKKYRLKAPDGTAIDKSISDSWRRVARALAEQEKDKSFWETNFFKILDDFRFLPAGRILAGSGSGRNVTLFNCFVMGDIRDDMGGIFDSLKEAALTMQQGGGIGYDFSTLRPKGALVKGVGADASGPLSFMDVWDSMCRTIMSAGSRRGAMMGLMSCDHPDLLDFIEAKQQPGRLRMFNLSVLVSDAFMKAVKDNQSWELKFEGVIYKSLPAREIWDKIMRATFAYAEPGVIFIDRINEKNNLYYCENIHGTNPCGEQPLPPYGACLLGSVNLSRFIKRPFETNAKLDLDELTMVVKTAVRMLDNVIDISQFPLPEQRHEAIAKRRIGLGITGLADALIMCNSRYGSDDAVNLVETWLKAFETAAYKSSIKLAEEKQAFPFFDKEKYLEGGKIKSLDSEIKEGIHKHGIRNALLTSVAPTGTISLFADNISSGLEPVFSFKYFRRILMPDGSSREEEVSDYAFRLYKKLKGEKTPLPASFVDVQGLIPRDHLLMQSTVQKYIDSSISKTINVSESISFDEFKNIYMQAYDLGCKGCTTYRPNDVTGAILAVKGNKIKEDTEPELPLGFKEREIFPTDEGVSGAVVQMFKPLDRPGDLEGKTYKLQWPDSDHAIYITLNDILDESGRIRPFEIFVNSKNMEHFSWTVALTRMISAVFRRGGDVSFVVEELKAVFDPRGGQWIKGKYVPSLLAAIGEVIERHMIEIGFLSPLESSKYSYPMKATVQGVDTDHSDLVQKTLKVNGNINKPNFRQCPKCAQASIINQEGCDICTSCGYSKCG